MTESETNALGHGLAPVLESLYKSILFQKILGIVDTILHTFGNGGAGFLCFLLGSVDCSGSVFLNAIYSGFSLFFNVACYVAGHTFSLFEGCRYGFESAGHSHLVGIRLNLVEICTCFCEFAAGYELLNISDTLLHIFGGSGGFDIIEK